MELVWPLPLRVTARLTGSGLVSHERCFQTYTRMYCRLGMLQAFLWSNFWFTSSAMLSLMHHLTSQSVYIPCDSPRSPGYHVLFITGNPGCIGYYHTFLSLLADKLSGNAVNVYGQSLANFVEEPGSRSKQVKTLGLQEQIDHVEELLINYVENLPLSMKTDRAAEQPKVILVGHSVGAYIGLELLRRRREREKHTQTKDNFHVCGYIGLWPTVTWIRRSPSGLKLAVGQIDLSHEPYRKKSLTERV